MDDQEKNDVLDDGKDAGLKVPCEVYSRIVGYLRPVQAWNQGKQQEYEDRRVFDVTGTKKSES